MHSFSPPCTDFAYIWLLCLTREEPGATPLLLLALLLLELPLLLTLVKLLEEPLAGERSHQLEATNFTAHSPYGYRSNSLYRSRSAFMIPFTNLISVLIRPLHSVIIAGSK